MNPFIKAAIFLFYFGRAYVLLLIIFFIVIKISSLGH
jgi:hypothetical protein